jgi:hypothetical protein
MPCWDSYLFAKEAKENNYKIHQDDCMFYQEKCSDTKHLESKIHDLTEMLCGLCKKVELELPTIFIEETRLHNWWEDHKANDKAIEEIEKIRGLKKELDDLEKRLSDYLEKA